MLWFLGNFQYFTIPIGFVGPSLGLSLGWSILAGVLGIWFGTLFMAFHATQGPVFGLPQMIQTRAQLGYRGVVVALFAVLFTYMAFNVADQVLMASGLHGAFGWNAAPGGHRHRGARRRAGHLRLRLGAPGVPVPAGHLVPVLRDHLGRHPGRARGRHAPHHPGGFIFAAFMAQFSVAAAYNITYAPYVSDYSRYMPRKTSPRGIIAAVFFGASGSAIWLIALGAWLATRLGVTDGLVGLQVVGRQRGRAARLDHRVPVRDGAAGHHGDERVRRDADRADRHRLVQDDPDQPGLAGGHGRRAGRHLVRASAPSISTSASNTAVSAVLNSLTLMLYLLVPWTALNLVDFFFVRRGHYAITDIFRPDGVYGAWGWRGLTAYFAGFAAEIPFMVLPPIAGFSYTGYFPGHLTNGVDYSWLVGLAVSGLVYLLLSRSLDLAAEQSAIDASERELRAIDALAGRKARSPRESGDLGMT